MSEHAAMKSIAEIAMNENRFLSILSDLISQVETLQNNPSQGLVPREDNAGDIIISSLTPFTVENGGPLVVERVHFTEGRGNIIIKYPGSSEKVTSFVGSHLDVVPANPEQWDVDPFKLKIEGDSLYGRGTTDCLGHVALITDLFCSLAEIKPALKRSVVAIFIANEENREITGIGVDGLNQCGKLDELNIKNGPVFWVDSADSEPCLGTAGMVQWSIKAIGKQFHSGIPIHAINPLELVMESVSEIQKRFYRDFPAHIMEEKYKYKMSCTMKPTQMECARGSVNQIPQHATIMGDCRITPFYKVSDAKQAIEKYIADINENLHRLPTRGPFSKYELPEEGKKGILQLEWLTEGEDGIACALDSEGSRALVEAIREVAGTVSPYSISGSLPLVRWMQDNGFDIQICGFGLSSRYHADNECCSLKKMREATRVMARIIATLESKAA